MTRFIESEAEHAHLAGLLGRIEAGLVAYEEWEIDVRDFGTAVELQKSLREILPHGPAPVTVTPVDLPRLRAAAAGPTLFERHRGRRARDGRVEVERRYFGGVPRSAGDPAAEWYVSGADAPRAFTMSLSADGAEVRGFAADHCFHLDDVDDRGRGAGEESGEASWFGIGFSGLPSVLVIPAHRSRLQVHLDHDGAYIAFTARDAEDRGSELAREQAYDDRWAHWLDNDVLLGQRELDEAQRRVEADIDAVMTQRGEQ